MNYSPTYQDNIMPRTSNRTKPLTITAESFSHVGHVRQRNEDSVLVLPERGLFVVADGMGGHNAGDVASKLCVETFERADWLGDSEQARSAFLTGATRLANTTIYREARGNGMGTTVVAALVAGREATVAHVGDSRAYLLRGRKLHQLTDDHQVPEGEMFAGQLTRAVGTHPYVTVDVRHLGLRRGDVLLLASDGLEVLDARTIAHLLAGPNAAHELLDAVLKTRAYDNASAIIIRVD